VGKEQFKLILQFMDSKQPISAITAVSILNRPVTVEEGLGGRVERRRETGHATFQPEKLGSTKIIDLSYSEISKAK